MHSEEWLRFRVTRTWWDFIWRTVLRGGISLAKKQIPLRLSEQLYDAIAAWAEDDFRSVNGQIEYLLTECVRQRKKNGKYVSEQ